MASPIVTATPDKATYTPGAPIVVSWTVTDPDNSTDVLRLEGTDIGGNPVSVDVVIHREDGFTMTKAYWVRTGVSLAIDNVARKATGIVPSV